MVLFLVLLLLLVGGWMDRWNGWIRGREKRVQACVGVETHSFRSKQPNLIYHTHAHGNSSGEEEEVEEEIRRRLLDWTFRSSSLSTLGLCYTGWWMMGVGHHQQKIDPSFTTVSLSPISSLRHAAAVPSLHSFSGGSN